MYGIYGDMIEAAERALAEYEQTQELLEYPEIQADKAYYLSVLSKYNRLKSVKDKLSALLDALEEERAFTAMLSGVASDGERTEIYGEISSLKRRVAGLSAALSDALGCKHAKERAYCRLKCKEASVQTGSTLFSLIKSDLLAHGIRVEDEKSVSAGGGYVREISFVAEGADAITRLSPLTGAHRVYVGQSQSEELCFAATLLSEVDEPKETDFKIEVFHARGAGGQNINKVETAVRVTYLPTGLTVVCQDERSQLRNKERALKTIEKRLRESRAQAEKQRIEEDVRAQFAIKSTPLSFDAEKGTITDTRLKSFTKIAFPLDEQQFTTYINGLISL